MIVTNGRCYDDDDYSMFVDYYTCRPLTELNHTKRGDVSITLCSPLGTCSEVLPRRSLDYISCTGYTNWPFMSVHFWGEETNHSNGKWNVTIEFKGIVGGVSLTHMDLSIYGLSSGEGSSPTTDNNTVTIALAVGIPVAVIAALFLFTAIVGLIWLLLKKNTKKVTINADDFDEEKKMPHADSSF
jgi:hypothetical protein